MRTGSIANKMVDPDFGQGNAREHELITLTEVSENGAVGFIRRLPAHSVTLDATLIAGRNLKPGDTLIVRATKPDHFGFHGKREPWRATAIVEVKQS